MTNDQHRTSKVEHPTSNVNELRQLAFRRLQGHSPDTPHAMKTGFTKISLERYVDLHLRGNPDTDHAVEAAKALKSRFDYGNR
jgi:hypothetical protein